MNKSKEMLSTLKKVICYARKLKLVLTFVVNSHSNSKGNFVLKTLILNVSDKQIQIKFRYCIANLIKINLMQKNTPRTT